MRVQWNTQKIQDLRIRNFPSGPNAKLKYRTEYVFHLRKQELAKRKVASLFTSIQMQLTQIIPVNMQPGMLCLIQGTVCQM